ncbi:L-threonine dehydratase biosynthetic IlvA [Halomonadaceae bacterium LMG 33818]
MSASSMLESYAKRILSARVYEAAIETPLSSAPLLSERLHNQVLIKREDLQPVFSFKIRGAYNRMVQLSPEQREKGVITASAGNHAQGVALAARQMGVKAVIVMPQITPDIKVKAVRARGAEVVLHGDAFNDALEHARHLQQEYGYTYVPPFDDPDVIAGQGTVAMEILRQYQKPIDAVFIQVGGGGLIAGMAAYIKYLHPDIRVIGVEPEDAACLKAALDAGEPVNLPTVGLFAEGVAVARIGEDPFKVAKECVDEVITVSTDEICAAVKDIFEDTRGLAEPSGAVSLAGLKKYVQRDGVRDQTLICVNSGANTNFDRLQGIAERTQIGEQREAILAVTIPEGPGNFKSFCRIISDRMVTEFNYRYSDPQEARIFVGLQVQPNGQDRMDIITSLRDAGYPVEDLSDNELAKVHVRHIGGGRGPQDTTGDLEEVLYRFEFPERPGALLNFLDHLPESWNLSLFHYRNHGDAYGRVLAGLYVPSHEIEGLESLLDTIGYSFWNETDNPAYSLFLR